MQRIMGCINSKKDINDVHPNIFLVINIDDDGTALWSGQLEVTRTEITLYRKGKEPTNWPLKCLRRYGYNVDQFSFEAGRRCLTGEGIYAFRCRRAEALFYTVQSYIQGRIYSDENTNPNDPYPIPIASTGPAVASRSGSQTNTASRNSGSMQQSGHVLNNTGSYVINRTGITTSQSLSPNGTIHSNSNQSRSTDTLPTEGNYLEPTPNRQQQPQTITTRFSQGLRLSSVSSGPISPDITSPGSPNSITNILEVTTLNPLPNNSTNHNHHGVSNLYQEFPMKECINNNNTSINNSNNRMSLDIPPQEQAPNVSTIVPEGESQFHQYHPPNTEVDASHMYMNVNIATTTEYHAVSASSNSKSNSSLISINNNNSSSFDENQYQNVKTPTTTGSAGGIFPFTRMNSAFSIDPSLRYENLELGELKTLLLRNRYSKPDIFAKVDLPLDKSEPCTPTSTNRKVNYIVLDLDQSNSSNNISSSTSTNGITSPTNGANNNNTTTSNSNVTTPSGLLPPESPHKASLGYATIDFNKTVALSNSTTPSSELDSEGSRKTRHNSTVTPLTRQSNSVSD